ncbi:MAG: GlxA family transcriptional regulator [Hyphomicrobiales bacterium]|nr:GlxA family transcriptional regulator [Hyphomicrobiales bacterium]
MDIDENFHAPVRIGILSIEGFAMMSYASLAEPFRGANRLSENSLYEIIDIGVNDNPVQSSGAANIVPSATVGEILKLDYLFVVAGGDPLSFNDEKVMNWLRRMARTGLRLGGVSGGPVILARAGLMNGRRMTLHWEHEKMLAEILPSLLIERTLYVIDRDRVTCAGGTTALDLTHALIAQHHGTSFARSVSEWFLHTEIRPSFSAQRGSLAERVGSTNNAILSSVQMMESHIADPLTLNHLASIAEISPRQLNRLFIQKLGRSIMKYYRELRLENSQKLLVNSSLTLTEIALATGFSGSSHFSRTYTAYFGKPPSQARR